jgi:hypothetical protein
MTHWLRALSAFPLSLPLAFEPAPEPGRFLARQAGARVEVACDALTVAWSARESVALRFTGANGAVRPVASEPLPGKVHYFVGRDPARWRRGVPLHGRVTCAGIQPGLDLVVHGREGRVEFDVIVAPGANLSAFALDAGAATLEPNGDLALRAGERRLVLRAPVSHQEIGGERRPVESRFAARGAGRFGFAVGAHDPSAPLVVDPVLELSTFAGGDRPDTARAVAVDDDGSIIVAGSSDSNDFPTTAGAFQEEYAGANDEFERGDAFVMKLAPGGTSLVWATYLGGRDPDAAEDVALGASGDVFVVGGTVSKDFPVTPGAFQIERGKNTFDAFAARLGPDGDTLVYGTYLGGKDAEFANGVAVGPTDEATIAGYTFSKDFPVTPGAVQTKRRGGQDAFVTRLAAGGDMLVWSTFLGGEELEVANTVAVGADGAAVVAGTTSSNQFPTTAGALQETYASDNDAFVSRLAPDGASLVWSTFFGGNQGNPFAIDDAAGVALDAFESVYLTGETLSRNLPVSADAFDPECGRNDNCQATDAYVAKLSSDGCALLYGTYLGDSDADAARDLAVDARGHAHVTGFTRDNDFPVTPDAFQATRRGAADVFYSELDAGGTDLVYSTFLGSGSDDSGNGVALSDAPRAHVVGSTSQNNFPIEGPAFQTDYGGSTDAFVAVFGGPAAMEPSLLASFELPGPVGAFGPFAGTLRVRNAGSAAAANVAATVTLDAALDLDSATPSQGSCMVAAATVTCAIGALAPGAEAEVDLAGTATQAGVLAASAALTADAAAGTRAAACVAAEVHDLAVTALKAPARVRVPAADTTTAKLGVEVENLSNHTERIADLAMLGALLSLDVTPTGGGCAPAAVTLDPKSGSKLPLELEPGKTLKIGFTAVFDCADTDFTATAVVDHTAIDGLVDADPGNDALSAPIDAEPR